VFIIKTQLEINVIPNTTQKRSTISWFHLNFLNESMQKAYLDMEMEHTSPSKRNSQK